jgi:hypothetical protein
MAHRSAQAVSFDNGGKMRTLVLMVLVIASIGTTSAFAADSHKKRVAEQEANFKSRRDKLLQSIAKLDTSLQAHGVEAKEIALARATLNEMIKVTAPWRDLKSRSTKTQHDGQANLDKYLMIANAQLAAPRHQLALIKKAEFEAWARANPEAAKLLEIQRRAEAAESAAMNAEMQAQKAIRGAAQAQRDAAEARQQAQEADYRARAAQQKSARAEDALRQHGIHSW